MKRKDIKHNALFAQCGSLLSHTLSTQLEATGCHLQLQLSQSILKSQDVLFTFHLTKLHHFGHKQRIEIRNTINTNGSPSHISSQTIVYLVQVKCSP